ncbi:xanthine dehydrogenase accessory protein XdhC [Luteipulveratus mongoliensis]|uniref:Molybdenum cofactor sulfurylase n=1 Tax=Luteipulveratus mongoliensis TaxID=571913 RepID=A0A0K1JJG0_9MICO|nr:xanthine dehydrogenase accessory protein XdhC [Luteipulveratus mongoliensis]AKU16857.1 molybdenum cofactor sulfurylase [Luteipulveratus mongoliensis]
MDWLDGVTELHASGQAGVLVTVAIARGHTPREAGAKMVVSLDRTWGSVGGGNLEAEAIERGRSMLQEALGPPSLLDVALNDRAPHKHGRQCCGGQVTLLFEPLTVAPTVAIFGVGHVGLELARILGRLDVRLVLIDSRPEQLADERLRPALDGPATVDVRHLPVPEAALADLPPGSHVLVMTHDHAEDAALCDSALRRTDLGSIGLIGSSAKWQRFRKTLGEQGHTEADLARITTPIGVPGVGGKEPATIALSVAAALLPLLTTRQ